MKTIKLGKKVVVSDPCYAFGTWCQAVIDGVKPGKYNASVEEQDLGQWGNRISKLIAVHSKSKVVEWVQSPADIGVDSGQCGIFDIESYKNDKYATEIPEQFGIGFPKKSGDLWYSRMAHLTLNGGQWGAYGEGVVSSSGVGDGSYVLYLGYNDKNEIVGFKVDYLLYDMEESEDSYNEDEN